MLKNTSFEKHAKRYHSYYINRFISMNCAVDMLRLGLFPNAKEITESYGAFEALCRFPEYDVKNPTINIVCVGDGTTPRTAATFAFRTKWNCYSIDPLLKHVNGIHRLQQYRKKIEECSFTFDTPTIICCVHSHAKLKECLKSIRAPELSIISIPCCVPQYLDVEPDIEYKDSNIWSPENTVKIWKRL